MTSKLRAGSLEAQGRRKEARYAYLLEAINELSTMCLKESDDEHQFKNGIGEAIACLVYACKPISKDKMRKIVDRFMKDIYGI